MSYAVSSQTSRIGNSAGFESLVLMSNAVPAKRKGKDPFPSPASSAAFKHDSQSSSKGKAKARRVDSVQEDGGDIGGDSGFIDMIGSGVAKMIDNPNGTSSLASTGASGPVIHVL